MGRAGGAGGGGGFGSFRGRVRGDAPAAEGRQAGTTAGDYFFSQSEGKDTLQSGRPAEERERIKAFGEASTPLRRERLQALDTASPPPEVAARSGSALGFKNGTIVAAAPPAATPSPITSAPAEDSAGKATAGFSLLGPAPALTVTPPVDGLEVARVPLQARGTDKLAGDLVAGGRALVPSQQMTEVRKGAELLRKPDVAWSDSGAKVAETYVPGGSVKALADEQAVIELRREVPMAGTAAASKPASQVESFGLAVTPSQSGVAARTGWEKH